MVMVVAVDCCPILETGGNSEAVRKLLTATIGSGGGGKVEVVLHLLHKVDISDLYRCTVIIKYSSLN